MHTQTEYKSPTFKTPYTKRALQIKINGLVSI